jgi:hypothetical protein
MYISCSFSFINIIGKKENGKKSRLFFTLIILVPGNCFVGGYDVEDLIKFFFLPSSRISSLKNKRGEK